MKKTPTSTESPASGTQEANEKPMPAMIDAAPSDGEEAANRFAPLGAALVTDLRANGKTDEQIAAIAAKRARKLKPKSVAKENLRILFEQHKQLLLDNGGGGSLFSGETAGRILFAHGLCKRPKRWNSAGDKLGGHGHRLPRVKHRGKMVYEVTFIDKSDLEKQVRQEQLEGYASEDIAELVAVYQEPGVEATPSALNG